MTLEEKKQIYLDRFPAIIGRRMAEQSYNFHVDKVHTLHSLILSFQFWDKTKEGHSFWEDIHSLYCNNETIEHQQILDIFHNYGIKP